MYVLGLHEDIQTKVRDEIDSVMGSVNNAQSDLINTDCIKDLKYLDCVLKEVQRVFPTAPFIGRELTEDTVISMFK